VPTVLPSAENIERAAALLRDGGVVAIPTETVYGLAANAFDARAVARVFEIKGRPSFDPLIVHVLDEAMLERVAGEIPHDARALIERFWPGPLTVVLPKAAGVPGLVTSGLATVGVRMPAHPVARSLLERAGVPLAAPSANRFGRLSPTRAEHVAAQLGDQPDLILDGGPCEFGIESTIVAFGCGVGVLRPGAITLEAIAALLPEARLEVVAVALPVAPGQLAHHYAPRTPLRLVEAGGAPGRERARAGFVGFARSLPGYAETRVLSESGDLREAAGRLFETLHELDGLNLARIDAGPVPERGLGTAIMDRLRRASAR
jgi:L-threonylcarbamoyladenylate synthase